MARPYSEAEWKAMFIRMIEPAYPLEAHRIRAEGTGLFRLYVDERGTVTNVAILKSTGHQILDSESVRALRQWRARSGTRREVDLPIHFTLQGARAGDSGMGHDGLGISKSRDR